MNANHEFTIALTIRVAISAIISRIPPKETSLLVNGVSIARYIVVITKIDSCISVVRISYFLDSKSKILSTLLLF